MAPENKATRKVRNTYNRIAPVYDFMEGLLERSRFSKWREALWSRVEGRKILELGVGTGKNFPYYPQDTEITAIDISEKMLERARNRKGEAAAHLNLEHMDIQELGFADNTFDSAVASFVFCSVPDPVKGLKEVMRVCKPGGKVVLLEHMLSGNRVMALLMNLANPLVVRIMGENINRRTVENVAVSGLNIERVTEMAFGIFKLIEARKASA